MASKNKMNKARNSYCRDALKWGKIRCKRLAFLMRHKGNASR